MKRVIRTIVATAVFATPIVIASPAHAAITIIRNDKFLADYSPVCGVISCSSIYFQVKDGTYFKMNCWKDAKPWPKAPYQTVRWFKGSIAGVQGFIWVNAAYVKNQTTVRHC